jgi:hypothetical protein
MSRCCLEETFCAANFVQKINNAALERLKIERRENSAPCELCSNLRLTSRWSTLSVCIQQAEEHAKATWLLLRRAGPTEMQIYRKPDMEFRDGFNIRFNDMKSSLFFWNRVPCKFTGRVISLVAYRFSIKLQNFNLPELARLARRTFI